MVTGKVANGFESCYDVLKLKKEITTGWLAFVKLIRSEKSFTDAFFV